MEELDLLKKAWKGDHGFGKVSEQEIYAMLHKRSSSIVKWILIISILEIVLWTTLTLCMNQDDGMTDGAPAWLDTMFTALNVVNYGVVLVFIILFYNAYRTISATESTRKLMSDILKTRRTVKWYVGYQLAMMVIGLVIGFFIAYKYNPQTAGLKAYFDEGHHEGWAILALLGAAAFIAVCFGLFWLFYRLLYGILLKRLYHNYSELKRIDTL